MNLNRETLAQFTFGVSSLFTKALGTAPSQYKRIAMDVPSSAGSNVYPWLGTLPTLRKWVGDRVIQNLKAHKYTIENEEFESTIGVKRTHLEDDQYGIYAPLFQDLGAQAGLHPDQLTFGLLNNGHAEQCYDGQYFFDADHPVGTGSVSNSLGDDSVAPWYLMCTTRPVKPLIFQKRRDYKLVRLDRETDENTFMRGEYLYGVDSRVNAGFGLWQCAVRCTSALDNDSYGAARAAMMSFKDDRGNPLGLVPDLLVVPPVHDAAGRKVVVSALAAGGATNEWANSAELLVSPWLA